MNRNDDIPPERNALPNEVDDHPDSGMPRQLRTQAENVRPLGREEAIVGGVPNPSALSEAERNRETVYGEVDDAQQGEDRADAQRGSL